MHRRRIWIGLGLGIPLALVAAFVIWGSTPLGPDPTAVAALASDAVVSVEMGRVAAFQPVGQEPKTGLVLYPGGRVDYRSYAPLARAIAAQGYLVVIPRMPLNLAVLAPERATEIIEGYPEIEAWAAENFPPDRLCERLNDLVCRRTSAEKFVTFIVALYDPETGSVVYANAGHNPGIVLRAAGGHDLLPAQGTPLGLFPGRTYGSGSLTLAPGDLLVLYTDGVTEAANPDDDEFGLDRLVELVRGVAASPLAGVEEAICTGLAAFAAGVPFHDDRTVVLLRRL